MPAAKVFALLFAPRPARPSPQDPEKHETRSVERVSLSSGGRIRTCDLRVMSPTSYQTAPPRVAPHVLAKRAPCQKSWTQDPAKTHIRPNGSSGAAHGAREPPIASLPPTSPPTTSLGRTHAGQPARHQHPRARPRARTHTWGNPNRTHTTQPSSRPHARTRGANPNRAHTTQPSSRPHARTPKRHNPAKLVPSTILA
jgi:hypothetical protein